MLENHNQLLQTLLGLIDPARQPYIETGRKFDKIILTVDGTPEVMYFVARHALPGRCDAGDIFGAKSKLAPNMRWYFGNLVNCTQWDWTGDRPVPVSDTTVMAAKKYGTFIHYLKVPQAR
jgi:hypothetical protein